MKQTAYRHGKVAPVPGTQNRNLKAASTFVSRFVLLPKLLLLLPKLLPYDPAFFSQINLVRQFLPTTLI